MERLARLPCSEACDRNKAPILEVLRGAFAQASRVLEVGSGTGQHAVWFARHLPHLVWQPSETAENLAGLRQRLEFEAPANVLPAAALDVADQAWPMGDAGAIFSANTLHIMSWAHVHQFFRGAGSVLAAGGILCVYGPFRYGGAFTTPSNAEFDLWLKRRDPASGVRDFEAVAELAGTQGFTLVADHNMPANNQMLIWHRQAAQ